MASPDKKWLTTEEAAREAGCTEGWLRFLLGRGDERLEGWKAGERAWLVSQESVLRFRETLSSRSTGRRGTAKRAAKKAVKRATKRRC